MSFISTIESGLNHDRVDKPLTYYTQKTDVYQLPIWDVNATKSSATEKRRVVETVENQLIGVFGAHINGGLDGNGYVIRHGAFIDASNHLENFLIGILSGSELVINSIYTGDKYNTGKELVFSGLSTGGTNYLWGTLIEQSPLNFDYLSSRQYGDIGARITNTFDPPQNSVFLGTYTSGSGFNNSLASKFTTVKEHVDNNQNPHGDILNQTNLVTSGMFVYNTPDRFVQPNLSSGSPIILNHEYLQNVITSYPSHVQVEGNANFSLLSGNEIDLYRRSYSITTFTNALVGFGYFKDGSTSTISFNGADVALGTQTEVFHHSAFFKARTLFRPLVNSTAIQVDSTINEDELNVDGVIVNAALDIPITLGNSTSDSTSVSDDLTFSHTVAAGDNKLLVLFVFTDGSFLISAPTYAGLPMSTKVSGLTITDGYRGIYFLANPPVGTASVVINGLGTSVQAHAVDLNNVNQTTPLGNRDTILGAAATTLSLTEPASSSSLVTFSTLLLSGAQTLNVGTLQVTSGLDVYPESRFRRNITLNSGATIDGLQVSLMPPYLSNECISGYTHIHSPFDIISGEQIRLSPKFYGAVTASTKFKNNIDLDPTKFKPTLKHENNSFAEDYWIRTFMPAGCNQLESIEIEHKITNGSNVDVLIYDCLGAEIDPDVGSRLVASTSLRTTIVSGIDQSGFTQRQPFDMKLTFNTSGAGVHYIGDITMNFVGKFSE